MINTLGIFLLLVTLPIHAFYEHIPTYINNHKPRKLAVFFDGTGQDEDDYTNIGMLHSIVTYQYNTNISTAYFEGLGTGSLRLLGLITGLGISSEVRQAYLYLVNNYSAARKDEIYIFGYSRGAYAARILSGLLYVAGLPSLRDVDYRERYGWVKAIYRAYFGAKGIDARKQAVAEVIGYWPKSIDVEFLGVWDTVAALGLPDYQEDIDLLFSPYLDQLCNIKQAAHALSIDDNRARIFTPVLLTRPHLMYQCDKPVDIDKVVDEVWFSGCHSDIGGGNKDSYISGVSLNWMLRKLKAHQLVPEGASVYEDHQDTTINPLLGLNKIIHIGHNRNLSFYLYESQYNQGRLKIHRSVIDRLAVQKPKDHEFQWLRAPFLRHCFKLAAKGLEFKPCEKYITVVDNDYLFLKRK